jgi:hypothetical protein
MLEIASTMHASISVTPECLVLVACIAAPP